MVFYQRLGLLMVILSVGLLLARPEDETARTLAAVFSIVGGMGFLSPWRGD
jgi:hypothetical protein